MNSIVFAWYIGSQRPPKWGYLIQNRWLEVLLTEEAAKAFIIYWIPEEYEIALGKSQNVIWPLFTKQLNLRGCSEQSRISVLPSVLTAVVAMVCWWFLGFKFPISFRNVHKSQIYQQSFQPILVKKKLCFQGDNFVGFLVGSGFL